MQQIMENTQTLSQSQLNFEAGRAKKNNLLDEILKKSKIDPNDISEILNPPSQISAQIPAGKPNLNMAEDLSSFNSDISSLDLQQLEKIGKLKKTALLHYQGKRPLEALRVLEEAIRMLPGDLELIYYEALCLFQLGKYERVYDILSELEKLDEEKILAGLGKIRAMCLLRTSKFAEAETYIRQLLTNSKNDRQYLNMLAYALERQDKLNDAKIILQRILEKDEFNTNACNTLAYVYYRLNENLTKALELIRKALNTEPENPLYLDTLAMVLYGKGQKLQALQAIKKANFFDPQNKDIQKHLGEISKDQPRH